MLEKLKTKGSKLLAAIYALVSHARRLCDRRKIENDRVLLIWGGHLGDILTQADGARAIAEHYKANGKKVYLACMAAGSALRALASEMAGAELLPVACYDGGDDTSRERLLGPVRRLLLSARGWQFETVVAIRSGRRTVDYLAGAIPCNEAWTCCEKWDGWKGTKPANSVRMLARRAEESLFMGFYTNKIDITDDETRPQQLKTLACALGAKEYKIRIAPYPHKGDPPLGATRYITVAVDSANLRRRWPAGKFVELIRWLLEQYPYDVYLTASQLGTEDAETYRKAFAGCARVKNAVGKTTMDEWFCLLRGSRFHIGVDSGSIHAAASVGTRAFSLCGVWEGRRLLPYVLDEAREGTEAPVCIYRQDVAVDDLPCYGCLKNGKGIGYGNGECYESCVHGKPCLCLDKIEVADVKEAIRRHVPA